MRILTESMLQDCGVSGADTVLIGLSGGADSVALTHALCRLRAEGALAAIYAAHLHHGIRGGAADADEAFCRAFCRGLDVPLSVERADVPAYAAAEGQSLELAARTLRYAFLRRAAKAAGADCIMTAHHRDDQAETLLLHLLRGCGTSGLAAMRPRNGDLARPLLGVSRASIEAYLAENGLTHCVDQTNASTDQTRNRIRHELMPLLASFNPNAAQALAQTARLAAHDDAFLERLAQEALASASQGDGYDRAMLAGQAPPVLSRAVRRLLLQHSGGVTGADIRRVCALLAAQTGTCIELRGGRGAWVDGVCVYVGVYPEKRAYAVAFAGKGETRLPGGGRLIALEAEAFCRPAGGREAYLDADKLPEDLVVRTRRDGDRFFPFGAPGERKLSDYLTDKKIPRHLRDMPLLASGREVYWVGGYGISQKAAITFETRRILHMIYEEETEQ